MGVYGPDDKQIGKIDDLLIDQNGSVQTVVIGVGGFLGFGKKDVAVPFSVVQWQTEARKVPAPAADQPPLRPVIPLLLRQQPRNSRAMKEVDPATAAASQGYPDKAVLNVTLDQLKAAPDFKYTSTRLRNPTCARQPASRNEENHPVARIRAWFDARRSGRP